MQRGKVIKVIGKIPPNILAAVIKERLTVREATLNDNKLW